LVLKLSQSKFSVSGKGAGAEPWQIPISYLSSNDKNEKLTLMKETETIIEIPNMPKDGWVKV